jgi:hypothetical protein
LIANRYLAKEDAMKQIRCAVLVTIIGFLTICAPKAFAFQVNPCYRVLEIKNGVPNQGRIRAWFINTCWLKNDFNTVHEHLTNFAINEYLEPGYYLRNPKVALVNRASGDSVNFITGAEWPKGAKPQHTTYGIIYGSWWNDDPLMFTWGEGANFTTGLLKLRRQFEDTHAEYRGGVSGCWVKAADYLPWHSHYGRMQYLHFMTNEPNAGDDQARLRKTTSEALLWMEFAYKVAIKKIKADDPLTEADEIKLGMPRVDLNYCLEDKKNEKVRTLFAPAGTDYEGRNLLTPDVALGSMLHVMQDSFSPAHTCRVDEYVAGKPYAVLTNVYNYGEQVKANLGDYHHDKDDYPGWLITYTRTGKHVYDNDPIVVGAWLIKAVDQQMEWDDVRKHLEQTIFKRSDRPASEPLPVCIGSSKA